jgi:predicted nucleic-acid-binding Zn-ribbon protein
MSKVMIPTKCAKCDSDKLRREALAMGGRHGVVFGRGYRFDVYICEECGHSEFFFKERTIWV